MSCEICKSVGCRCDEAQGGVDHLLDYKKGVQLVIKALEAKGYNVVMVEDSFRGVIKLEDNKTAVMCAPFVRELLENINSYHYRVKGILTPKTEKCPKCGGFVLSNNDNPIEVCNDCGHQWDRIRD